MTYTKEQISQAFIEVLNERVPDFGELPDHVFSARFEKKMNALIRREAAHPWAVRHPLARNLIAAMIVTLLILILCMSVGAIRNSIFNFFRERFDTYDVVYFETPEKEKIERDYVITELPKGFLLDEEERNDIYIRRSYKNGEDGFITLTQELSVSYGSAFDNERMEYDEIELDGRGVFISAESDTVILIWDQDGYVFLLSLNWKNVSTEDAIALFRSIRPVV